MKYKIQSKAILFAFILLALISDLATADLMNGSFETGDLTGWSIYLPSGSWAAAFNSWDGWGPTDGTYLGWLRGPYAIAESSRLYQTFEASSGDTLTFDYFWDSSDIDSDIGTGIILDGTTGSTVATLFEHSAADASTPWTTPHYSFADSGTYTLSFEIYGGTIGYAWAYLGIDNVALTTVPVPAAVLLGILGLSVAGIKLRKFA